MFACFSMQARQHCQRKYLINRKTQRKNSGRQLACMFLNLLVPLSNFSKHFDVLELSDPTPHEPHKKKINKIYVEYHLDGNIRLLIMQIFSPDDKLR